MKKLILIALLAIYAVACTKPVLEDYDTELKPQAIEHSEVGQEDHPEELMEGDPDRNSD